MSTSTSGMGIRVALACVVLLAVLLGGQALAGMSAPPGGHAATGRAIGQTGFAYLGGLRTFAAAVLWNRLDPQFDDYYANRPLAEQTQLLPTMRLVTLLDPQFAQAYFNAAYIVTKRGDRAEGLRIAQEGIKNNPISGLLRANYVQLLMIQDKVGNRAEILRQSALGLRPDTFWQNTDDQVEGYVTFRAAYATAGDQKMVDALTAAIDKLRGSTPTSAPAPSATTTGTVK